MLLEFTILCKDNIIIEEFFLLNLLQKFIQLFIKGHLCMPLVSLPLYLIFSLICISIIHSELLHLLMLFQKSFFHVPLWKKTKLSLCHLWWPFVLIQFCFYPLHKPLCIKPRSLTPRTCTQIHVCSLNFYKYIHSCCRTWS